MIIFLLIVIILLLGGIIAMMVTGWPGQKKNEIDRTGQDIRRELAQQRADTVQLLHSMRIELEDSLRDVIEQKFDAFEVTQSRGSSRRRRSYTVSREPNAQFLPGASNGDDAAEGDNGAKMPRSACNGDYEEDRQLQLFQAAEPQKATRSAVEEQMRSLLEQSTSGIKVSGEIRSSEKTEKSDDDGYISMIRVLPSPELYDDIPDIENLTKLEDAGDSRKADEPKTIRLKSSIDIDDIPDIEEL
ncbi:MAG: hypothetical protein HGB36_04525 [Chlorobiaceae bacterium]|nr:hypothetical protein [Chlorobiaceae bacterium]NTW82616.1 hypothetical protein [Chlorobiaceae bacterium]